VNEVAVLAELRELGFAVHSRSDQRWAAEASYEEPFELLSKELWLALPESGGGQEKLMATSKNIAYVVKVAGDPAHQAWQDGMQSLFEEYHGSRYGLNGHHVVAESLLLWHDSGAPVLVQEKLVNLTNKVSEELGSQLPWLPRSWYFYSQIGQRSDGEWRIYDLDAGSSYDFYPEDSWDGVMAELTENYYERRS